MPPEYYDQNSSTVDVRVIDSPQLWIPPTQLFFLCFLSTHIKHMYVQGIYILEETIFYFILFFELHPTVHLQKCRKTQCYKDQWTFEMVS